MKKCKILDFFYPPTCPSCGVILKANESYICRRCKEKLSLVGDKICYICGKEVDEDEEYCSSCKKDKKYFDQGIGVLRYNNEVKNGLYEYKHNGIRVHGEFFGKLMYSYGKEYIKRWNIDVIVPVPMDKGKLRKRGFNQAEDLARYIHKYSAIALDTKVVVKTRKTMEQKELSMEKRQKNLCNAFSVVKSVKGKNILVVDDVYTTGSTMNEMAKVLKNAGGNKVYFLTLSITSDK